MDESGRVYVFQDVTSADLLSTYLELQKDAAEVTESEIFSNLASKYKQIKLENLHDAEKRMGVSPFYKLWAKNIWEFHTTEAPSVDLKIRLPSAKSSDAI